MAKVKVTLNLPEEIIEDAKIFVIKSKDYKSMSHFVEKLIENRLSQGCVKDADK